jgi:hypothetical protein
MAEDNTSIVQKPRDYSEIIKLGEKTAWDEFLDNPTTQALEAFTGALALGVKQTPLAAGRMAQAIVKGKMLAQLAEEWKALREAGKLRDDLGESDRGLYTWAELVNVIDQDCPDEERLEALKAMFYAVNKVSAEDADRIQAYQLWRMVKEMNSGDLLVLKVIYSRMNQTPNPSWDVWMDYIAKESGLGFRELLERHEKRLIDFSLLTPRFRVARDGHGPESGIHDSNNRLTQVGVRFCQNIRTFQIDLEAAGRKKPK